MSGWRSTQNGTAHRLVKQGVADTNSSTMDARRGFIRGLGAADSFNSYLVVDRDNNTLDDDLHQANLAVSAVVSASGNAEWNFGYTATSYVIQLIAFSTVRTAAGEYILDYEENRRR